MRTWLAPTCWMVAGLLAAGCVSAQIQVVDERTALENQILGSYEELDRDLQLVASVRAVDEQGARRGPPRFSDIRAQAVAARQTQQFNLDDVMELKAKGCLGEGNDGLLAARPCQAAAAAQVAERIARMVAAENQSRKVLLLFVVTTSPDLTEKDSAELARAWARLNRERAAPGHWVQAADGQWARK